MIGACLRVMPLRRTPASIALALFFTTSVVWAITQTIEMTVPPGDRPFWGGVKILAIQCASPMWLVQALCYARPASPPRPWLIATIFAPCAAFYTMMLIPATSRLTRYYDNTSEWAHHGPLYTPNMVYMQTLVVIGTIIAMVAMVKNQYLARRRLRAIILLGTVTLPLGGNMLHNFDFFVFETTDPASLVMCAMSPVMMWALAPAGANMRTYSPESILRAYHHPAVLVGTNGQVAELNSAAERLFGDSAQCCGLPLSSLIPGYPALAPTQGVPLADYECHVNIACQGEPARWQVRRRVVRDERDAPLGHLLTLEADHEHASAEPQTPAMADHAAVLIDDTGADMVGVGIPTSNNGDSEYFVWLHPTSANSWFFAAGTVQKEKNTSQRQHEILGELAVLVDNDPAPDTVAHALSEYLYRRSGGQHPVPISLVHLEQVGSELRVSSVFAGHEPSLVFSSNAQINSSGIPGPAAGLWQGAHYTVNTTTLSATEQMVLIQPDQALHAGQLIDKMSLLVAQQRSTDPQVMATDIAQWLSSTWRLSSPVVVLQPLNGAPQAPVEAEVAADGA